MHRRWCGVGGVLAAAGLAWGASTTLKWAGEAAPGPQPPIVLQNALDAPDGFVAAFVSGASATFTGFGAGEASALDSAELATLLGVPVGVVEAADFVIFECNPQGGAPFQDSVFTFSDGVAEETFASGAATATGVVGAGAYKAFFGVGAGVCSGDWPFLLFDLVIDASSASFSVEIAAGDGAPFPDALGVIVVAPACPEDVDGSGAVDSADLNALLAGFGCAPGEACGGADIDADGDVDSADLNALLAAFGTPCA